MSDARPNDSEAAALDAVLDELLQQVASHTPIEDHAHPATPTHVSTHDSAHEPTDTTDTPDGFDDPLINPPSTRDPAHDAAPEVPDAPDASDVADGTAADREVLSDSLDDLLREASDLQQTINAVTPPLSEGLSDQEPLAEEDEPTFAESPEPEASEPPAPPPSGRSNAQEPLSDAEPGEHPEPQDATRAAEPAPSLDSLDEQLAALTDDLLAGEIESPDSTIGSQALSPSAGHTSAPTGDGPAAQARDDETAPAHPEGHTAALAHAGTAHAASKPRAPSAAAIPVHATPSSNTPSLASRLQTLAATHGARIARAALGVGSGLLLTLLALVSAPIRHNRTLQQSIGWLALYTLFLASGVWIYLLAFRGPSVPASHTPAPSILNHNAPHHGPDARDPGSTSGGSAHHSDDAHAPDHQPTPQLVSVQTPLLNRPTYAKSAASQKEAGAKSDGHGKKDAGKGKDAGKAKDGGGH